MSPRIPPTAWQAGMHVARRIARSHDGVIGCCLGWNMVGGRQRGRAIRFFVREKLPMDALDPASAVPAEIRLRHRGRRHALVTDVVEIPELAVEVQSGPRLAGGLYTWPVDLHRSVMAAHLADEGEALVLPDGTGARVGASLAEQRLDAAVLDHDQPTDLRGAWGLGPDAEPRDILPSDITHGGSVWPRESGTWTRTSILGIDASFVDDWPLPDLSPRHLILTRPRTRSGDSGGLLLGLDGDPLGFLTGRVGRGRDGAWLYSIYTPLSTVLDLLP